MARRANESAAGSAKARCANWRNASGHSRRRDHQRVFSAGPRSKSRNAPTLRPRRARQVMWPLSPTQLILPAQRGELMDIDINDRAPESKAGIAGGETAASFDERMRVFEAF